jgi:hypothetical protein
MTRWVALAALLAAVLLLPQESAAAGKLASIFQSEMLGAQLRYLETITGPAMHIDRGAGGVQIRDYRVEGCKLRAWVKGGKALGYSLDLAPDCSFELANFLGNNYPSTKGLTIGRFAAGAFGPALRVQSSCIDLCPNAADATVDFTFEGPHAVDFVDIVLTVVLADDASVAAAQRWAQTMRATENSQYVLAARFNCDTKYDAAAVKEFADIPVNRIAVGYEPNAAVYKRACGRRAQRR